MHQESEFILFRSSSYSYFNAIKCTDYFFFVYSTKKMDENGIPTSSAHPARFSPDDKFSKERITCKRRFNILPTQVINRRILA
jgi:H/ACA ribonucleoprotein complex subunit 3